MKKLIISTFAILYAALCVAQQNSSSTSLRRDSSMQMNRDTSMHRQKHTGMHKRDKMNGSAMSDSSGKSARMRQDTGMYSKRSASSHAHFLLVLQLKIAWLMKYLNIFKLGLWTMLQI